MKLFNYNQSNKTNTDMVDKELKRLASIKLSAFTKVRTPICVTLDLSGSMTKYIDRVKSLFLLMNNELKCVGTRDFTLIIMVIHNNKPTIMYFGDLKEFDCENFLSGLPEPNGNTPLAKSFNAADEILTELNDTLERERHWYTIPVFFSITDCKENGSEDDCKKAVKKYSEDISNGDKLLVEFVTGTNPDGLKLGGYKVPINGEKGEEKVAAFMRALRGATSSDVKIGDNNSYSKPLKDERAAYNRYVSDIMLFNFRVCYDGHKD